MDYTFTTTVSATTQIVGFHRWPGAKEYNGGEVGYLENLHRHKFGIRVELSVESQDREIEFHMLQRQVKVIITDDDRYDDYLHEIDFGRMSCEAIASAILKRLITLYPDRILYRVTVDEDGENGSTVQATAQ